MNLKPTLATGFLTVVAFATVSFMPANAQSIAPAAPAAIASGDVIFAFNSQETSQHLVWDLTYGDHDLPAKR